MPEFKVGDRVKWDEAQGTGEGEIVDVAITPGDIENFRYSASREHPKYIVKSTETGALAAHTAEELRKD